MKRVLCITANMNTGGAETFLMKIYRNIDRSKYQLDFCINVKEKCFYEDEILALGGKIYRIPSKSENLQEFRRQLSAVVRENQYQYVLRITSSAMGLMDLKIAKKAGAKVCCARSSNSSDGNGIKTRAVHFLGRLLYAKYVDVAIAPSDLAAQYTFGKKMYADGNVHILHNAVDLDYYKYSEEEKNRVRKEFSIAPDVKVLGHIGRFMQQKNHLFLLDVFHEVYKQNRNTVLLLVGDGELKESVKQKAAALGLLDSVIFTGVRKDIPALLSAMDVFVFPSLYEGMPNTVIEAQATGLPCIIADTITRGVKLISSVKFLSLSDSAVRWAEAVLDSLKEARQDTKQTFVKNRYDIASSAKDFVDVIFHYDNRG